MGKVRITNYSNTKEILKFDHYVSEAIVLATENGVVDGDKKIVKAGTILPANDATAKGILLYDVDVTNGENTGALVLHGFIDKTKLGTQPTTEAKAALTMIKFL